MHSPASAFWKVCIGVRARWSAAVLGRLVPRASERSTRGCSSAEVGRAVSGFGLGCVCSLCQFATAVLVVRRVLVPGRLAACKPFALDSAAPNHSLNRTLHSLPAFGLQKPSPNPVNLFRAG